MVAKLKEFYQAYQAWLDAGAPDYKPFNRYEGLCVLVRTWACDNGYEDIEFDLRSALEEQFAFEKLCTFFPFGEEEYMSERDTCTMHLNPKRIAWVKAHL